MILQINYIEAPPNISQFKLEVNPSKSHLRRSKLVHLLLTKSDLLPDIKHQLESIIHRHPGPIGRVVHVDHFSILVDVDQRMIRATDRLVPRKIDVVVWLTADGDLVVVIERHFA